MNTKKDAPTSAATLAEAGAEIAACSRAAISCNYSTTSAAGRQIKIADYLSHGQENAIPRRELERLTSMDGRTIRLMIQQERLAGTPICADNLTGYYLPATVEEKAACVRSLRHRAGEIMRTNGAFLLHEKMTSPRSYFPLEVFIPDAATEASFRITVILFQLYQGLAVSRMGSLQAAFLP